MAPSIDQKTDDYDHVRFNDPDEFVTVRTPGWAEHAASSVAEGAEVRTSHEEGVDNPVWDIQSVLVPTDEASDGDDAKDLSQESVEKIES